MGQFTDRYRTVPGAKATGPAATDEKLAKTSPALLEYLTETVWPDGKPRITATLLILCEDGHWKACLNDRAAGRTGWVSALTLADLMTQLEKGLANGSIEFRCPRQAQRR